MHGRIRFACVQIQRIVHRTGSNVDVWPANIGPPQAYVAVVSERAVGVLAVAVVLRHAKLRRAPAAYFPAPVCEDPSSVPSEAASCTHASEFHSGSASGPYRALGMQPERSVAADVGTPPGALLPSTPQAKPTTSRSMQQAELTRFFGSVSRVATPVACSASLDCSASARSTAPSADPRQAAAPYCASGACALAAEAGPSVVGAFTQPGASQLGCSPDAANPAPTPNLCAAQPCLAATRVARPLAMHGGAANTPMQLASSSTGSVSCPLAPAPGPLQAVDAPSDLLREQRTRKRGRIARMCASAASADAHSAEADRRQALQYLSTNCALKKVARGCDGPATWHSASVASRHAAASTAPCHTTAISTPTCSLVLASDGRVVPRRSAVGKPRLRAVFSVRALWVASDFEGQGVSAQLLDVARRECMAGMAASAEEVAWAEWLPGHAALAAEYCGGREKVLLCR